MSRQKQTTMTKAKICGLKTNSSIEAAAVAGADYIGLVFFKKSPRHLALNDAAKLATFARQSGPKPPKIVALMVEPSDSEISDVLDQVDPDILQLHGHESLDRVCEIKDLSKKAIWKAVAVATPEEVAAARKYKSQNAADMILFDAKPPDDIKSLPGGNGLTFDWRILNNESPRHDFALAGGLTAQNVAEAIRLVAPAIVDVSSGVESAPGKKDDVLIGDFIRAVHGVKQTA